MQETAHADDFRHDAPGPSREINLCRKQLMRMTLDMTQGNTYALKTDLSSSQNTQLT